MLLTQVRDASRFGQVILDTAGRISGFVEKGGSRGAGCINAGVYLLGKHCFDEHASQTGPLSLEREVFPRWVAARRLWGSTAEAAPFIDIGTPESLEAAEAFLAAHRAPAARFESAVDIRAAG